ncbi:putative altered inheritance of mitochondria protein 13, mitochondrial [Geopyxis carbonaria]|nr:putative altered inheritance of mitochondria protein 13, mitochondrial [Geopyxis carbonaria]
MGSSASKPTTTAVFHGETPVRFSTTLVSTLQSASETDSTRAKSLELHIQARVAEELAALDARVGSVDAQLALEAPPAAGEELTDERKRVKGQIAALKRRLEGMPQVRELSEGMKTAREGVVACLKKNETTPLDCWKEVEAFKEQTRRLEKAFVVATVGRDY